MHGIFKWDKYKKFWLNLKNTNGLKVFKIEKFVQHLSPFNVI